MINTLEYYQNNYELIFNSVENPNFRIWKVIDENKILKQNRFQITTPKHLLQFIKSCKNPQALYVSVSQFLNPQSNKGFFANQKVTTKGGHYFYPRSGWVYADNLLIQSDFFIDIDDDNLDIVQEDARKIINYMETRTDYKFKSLTFSGSRGIHLIYTPLDYKKIADPVKRIHYQKLMKEKLANEIIKLNLKTIDKNHLNIITDVFRVYAVKWSMKSSGNVVQPINKSAFMTQNIYDILSLKPTKAKKKELASEIPEGINDQKVASDEEQSSSQLSQAGERFSGLSSQSIFKFTSNTIDGLDNNYITVIKKNKKRFRLKALKNLQKTYNLSDFHIMGVGNHIFAYNLKLVQFTRLVKILRKAKSENLSFFITRRHTPIQISDTKDKDGNTIEKIKYIGNLKSEYGLNDNHSRPHSNLFKASYKNMCGKEYNRQGVMRVIG